MGKEVKDAEEEGEEGKRNPVSCFLLVSPFIVFSIQWGRRRRIRRGRRSLADGTKT